MAAVERPTEADYFARDDDAHHAGRLLRRTSRPAARARLLTEYGDVHWHMSALHTAVFGEDLNEYVHAQSLADSARLLWILAEAEHCRGQRTRWPLPSGAYTDRADSRTVHLQHTVDQYLDAFVAGEPRRPLQRAMTVTWLGLTRGQAVQAAARVGLPWWSR